MVVPASAAEREGSREVGAWNAAMSVPTGVDGNGLQLRRQIQRRQQAPIAWRGRRSGVQQKRPSPPEISPSEVVGGLGGVTKKKSQVARLL